MSERCGTSKSGAVLRAATAAGSGSERRTALEARARAATSKLLSRLSLPPSGVEAVWSRTNGGGQRGGAWLDPGRRFRYLLWRAWGDAGRFALFILLNPSTADQETNDPTVERCERRARAL